MVAGTNRPVGVIVASSMSEIRCGDDEQAVSMSDIIMAGFVFGVLLDILHGGDSVGRVCLSSVVGSRSRAGRDCQCPLCCEL